jgi:hypothetical protein
MKERFNVQAWSSEREEQIVEWGGDSDICPVK